MQATDEPVLDSMPASVHAALQPSLPDDDHALAQRAAAGDTGAFETIMRRHNRALFRTARSITQDDAEVIVKADKAPKEAGDATIRFSENRLNKIISNPPAGLRGPLARPPGSPRPTSPPR